MKTMKQFLALFFCTVLSTVAMAQMGTIRGTVTDGSTGETMIGVTVVIKNTTNGAATDLDGKFEIKAEPGVYDVQVTYISYNAITIEGVEVKAGEVTLLDNIAMGEDATALEEVVITAEVVKVTESALLTVKKKSVNMIDGISSANFRKIGDSNAASAVKRVPGVSIEGGKYVYVRGLGDRYTKSTLNGMEIPGLDPDRNSLQMDIFPTNVLDNIIVKKTFTPDLPADFTGGIVDIGLKDFPDERVASISVGLGYTPSMHLNADYLTYEGSSTDFLGFDNGLRDNPTNRSTDIPATVADAFSSDAQSLQMRSILDDFSATLATQRQNSFMDYSLGFSLGNQISGDKVTWGYNFALTYKNDTKFYDEVEYGRYGKDEDTSALELDRRELQTGAYGENNVLVGTLGGIAMKTQLTKVRMTLLHLQNGVSKAGLFDYVNTDQGANFDAYQHNLEYNQRAISNLLLHGTHQFSESGDFRLEWKLSGTQSAIEDPDIRFTRYRSDTDRPTIGTEAGLPQRLWRYLDETNLAGRTDATYEYELNGLGGKLRGGVSALQKDREYEIQDFQLNLVGVGGQVTGNPDELFSPELLWNPQTNRGVAYAAGFLPVNTNAYDASATNIGFYVSNELNLTEKLNTVIGLRAEKYTQTYTGLNQEGLLFDEEKVLDDLDLFPSVNLIYTLNEQQNLRASFSRTIARPSFKETSFATILDPLTGRTFVGGLFPDIDVATGETVWDGNLQATNINNFDVRWEIYQPGGQTIAVSGFYKTFENPIEIVQYIQAANNFQPRNVGNGEVLGIELEARKHLGFISEQLSSIFFQTNLTFTSSSIDMSATEFNSRVANAREGQQIENTRAMAGQAPYIINTGFLYDNDKGLEASAFYNVQGPTLHFVGIADRPDVYTVPFHSLNLAVNKTFGPQDNMRIGFKAANLLNDKKEKVFRSHEASDQFFESLAPGSAFDVSFSYSF